MAKLDYATPLTLKDVAKTRLGDDFKSDIGKITLGTSHKGKSGDFSYQLGADFSVSIELFNSDNDKDSHKVLGKRKKSADPSADTNWLPLIERGSKDAWMKYTTSASVNMGAQLDFGPVLGMKANGYVDHFYYHKQPANKLIVNAVLADLDEQKLAFVLDDVLSLGHDQAVGLATGGHVEASLKISWSDIFATGMSKLAGLVDSPQAVAINVSAGASAEFKVSLDDDFKLVFLGLPDGRFRVALRKARSSSFKAGVEIGISAAFAKPKQVEMILHQVIAGLLGMPLANFKKLVTGLKDDLALKDLTGWKKDLADEAVERLGLDDDVVRTTELLDELLALEKKASGVIKEIATSKATFSFSYEYSRIATDSSIFEGDFTDAAIKRLFGDILAGRFRVLLDDVEAHPGQITVRRFLNEKSLIVSEALGFSLGFGKWAFSGKENTMFKFVSQENAHEGVRYSLLGSRKYVGKDWMEGYSTYVEFKADMPSFGAPRQVPGLSQFDLGLSLIYTEDQARMSLGELRSTIDLALLWGVGPENDLDRLTELGRSKAAKGTKTESKVTLTVSNAALRGFCEWVANRSQPELGAIIAGAMDYWDMYPTRHYIQTRRNAYADIWTAALQQQWKQPAAAAYKAVKVLRNIDSTLAHREKRAARQRDVSPYTVYGTFRNNRNLMADFQTTLNAFTRLHLAALNNEQYQVLEKIAPDIHRFGDTRFKIRVLGALVNAYRQSGHIQAGTINAALSVKYARGEKILVIGQKKKGS